jgi:hypothetical protein
VEETEVHGENLIQTCFTFCNRVRFGNSDKHFSIVVEFEIFGYKKKFEDSKGGTRRRKLKKNRQRNGQKKEDK